MFDDKKAKWHYFPSFYNAGKYFVTTYSGTPTRPEPFDVIAKDCSLEHANAISLLPEMIDALKLAQVRLFMENGMGREYELIDDILKRLGDTSTIP